MSTRKQTSIGGRYRTPLQSNQWDVCRIFDFGCAMFEHSQLNSIKLADYLHKLHSIGFPFATVKSMSVPMLDQFGHVVFSAALHQKPTSLMLKETISGCSLPLLQGHSDQDRGNDRFSAQPKLAGHISDVGVSNCGVTLLQWCPTLPNLSHHTLMPPRDEYHYLQIVFPVQEYVGNYAEKVSAVKMTAQLGVYTGHVHTNRSSVIVSTKPLQETLLNRPVSRE